MPASRGKRPNTSDTDKEHTELGDIKSSKSKRSDSYSGNRRSDIGTEEDRDGVRKLHDSCTDEGYQEEGDCTTTLDDGCRDGPHSRSCSRVFGKSLEKSRHRRSGKFLGCKFDQTHRIEHHTETSKECHKAFYYCSGHRLRRRKLLKVVENSLNYIIHNFTSYILYNRVLHRLQD